MGQCGKCGLKLNSRSGYMTHKNVVVLKRISRNSNYLSFLTLNLFLSYQPHVYLQIILFLPRHYIGNKNSLASMTMAHKRADK